MGSDAPFPLGEPNPVLFVRDALSSEQAEAVLNNNFERMLEA